MTQLDNDSMNFSKILNRLHQSEALKKHTLSDAKRHIFYADLPHYFNVLETSFQSLHIEKNDCVAFEYKNTIETSIILLFLFYREQNFLLLPAEGNALKEPDFKPNIPDFCKTHISVSSVDSATKLTAETLIKWVNVYSHQAFNQSTYNRVIFSEPQLLLRTSGSMGDAKMVLFSHAKLIANANNCVSRFGLNEHSRITIAIPIFHLYGLGAGFIPALIAGASIDLQEDTNILRFMAHQRRFKPDVIYTNPTLCAMLVKIRRKSQQPFKQTISAGSALSESLYHQYQKYFGLLTNLYGSTEMGAIATTTKSSGSLKPMPNVKIEVDRENQHLYCSHPYGFDGYIDSQGNALDIKTSPYETGDIAKILDNDSFDIIARAGDSCNRAGFLVQFGDIEQALLKIKEVNQALVLTTKEETLLGEKLYAFCLLERGDLSAQTIRQLCFDFLPKYAIPDEIILLEFFPLLANGKIDRQTLKHSIALS